MITKRLRIAEEQSLPAFLTEEERTVLAHIPTLPSHISLAFRTMLATGVDFHSHRLRHTLATRLLAKGTPIDVVQEFWAMKT